MTTSHPPLRRKQRRRQEPDKQYEKSDYDGSNSIEPIEAES